MAMEPGQSELENLRRLLAIAKPEDLGDGDVTGDMLPEGIRAAGRFVAREEMVLCGVDLLDEIARAYDEAIVTQVAAADGRSVRAGEMLATWTGPARGILAAERVALNFLQRLSGVATLTRKYVDAVAGTGAEIYDTRKTTPGWRTLEKYAVRCGGGRNHRRGLYDAVLVKDNHLAAMAGDACESPMAGLAQRFDEVRSRLGLGGFIEIEVDTLEQLDEAIALGVDVILLDNMSPERMREAVARRSACRRGGEVLLEASGGITLGNVRAVASAGVERIAVGALTHSARAVDIALDIEAG